MLLINVHYNHIVKALSDAADLTVPCFSSNVLKAYWSVELNELKKQSIMWHDIWISAGKPMTGVLFNIKTKCKYKYKLGIRSAYEFYESKYSDEFVSHFLNKDMPQFWKVWNMKFRKNVSKQVIIDVYCNDADIGNVFADNFKKVYSVDVIDYDLHDLNFSEDNMNESL